MDTFIEPGRLNRKIAILAQSTEQDESGQPIDTWKPVLITRAAIDVLSGSLKFAASAFISKATSSITIRYPHQSVSAANRVKYVDRQGEHIYEIEAALNDKQANIKLVLLVYELNGSQ